MRTLGLAFVLSLVCASAWPQAKRIAVTIDDLPVASSTPAPLEDVQDLHQGLRSALQRHRVSAVGFVNEDRLLVRGEIDARVALLEAWLAAGQELGNHSFGHVGLWATPLPQAQDAVLKGEVFTRWLLAARGQAPRYYRHPYTQTGRDEAQRVAFEAFLAERGYTVAPFTVEHDDHLFSCVYDHAPPDERAVVRREYLAHFQQALTVYETMSDELLGRQVPQVLLLHATRLNADMLDELLSALKARGYQFVTLAEAMQDGAYALPTRPSQRFGPSWLARWARAQGKKLSVYGQPDPAGRSAELARRWCQGG